MDEFRIDYLNLAWALIFPLFFFLVAAHHLLLYIMRPKDTHNIFFVILCIVFGFYACSLNELKELLFTSTQTRQMLRLFCFMAVSTLLLQFLHCLLRQTPVRWGHYGFVLAAIISTTYGFGASQSFYSAYLIFALIITCAYLVMSMLLLVMELRKNNSNTNYFIEGLIFISIGLFHDLSHELGYSFFNNHVLQYTSLIFILGVTSLLSYKYTQALNRVENANIELEKKIADRTNSLQTLNKKLKDEITEKEIVETKLRHDSLHDALTHLPNRTYFLERGHYLINKAKRNPDLIFCVLFIDLDRFKVINDSLGHKVGDLLLIEVANKLKSAIREVDMLAHLSHTGSHSKQELSSKTEKTTEHVLARLGGDEFTIILDDLRSKNDVHRIIERILKNFEKPIFIAGHQFFISMSIGVDFFSPDYSHPEEMLRDADIAMYRAKNSGGKNFAIFDQTMHNTLVERLTLENQLRLAIEQTELELFFQPIYTLQPFTITCMETLARWPIEEDEWIPPSKFISLAEETGLILPLGEWILENACKEAVIWQNRGYPEIGVSINISAIQLLSQNFISTLEKALDTSKLKPELLKLELTESMLIGSEEQILELMNTIREMGVQLSIDDFGTQYSSLSYLKKFPIQELKIDRSFTAEIESDKRSLDMMEAIIQIGKKMNIEVVVEGIENVQQLDLLQPLGCDKCQGFLFSRPLPLHEIEALFRKLRAPTPKTSFQN